MVIAQRNYQQRAAWIMKAAFAVWNGKIAPVFDVAGRVQVVEVEAGRIVHAGQATLPPGMPGQKAIYLAGSGVQELICGAISQQIQAVLEVCGIRVISFVTGDLEEIIQAWLAGTLEQGRYAMPGCCGRGRRGRPVTLEREDRFMRARNQGRSGPGGRQGGGGPRARQGGGPGRRASGTDGSCVCPKCGHKVPHQRGVPCFEQTCPECGAAMIRE